MKARTEQLLIIIMKKVIRKMQLSHANESRNGRYNGKHMPKCIKIISYYQDILLTLEIINKLQDDNKPQLGTHPKDQKQK